MDEEQVKALIAAALGDFESKLTTTIDTKNAGLAASLTREIKKLVPEPKPDAENPAPSPAADEPEGKLTMKALQQQLQQLQEEGKRKDEAAFSARKTSALTTAIASHKALNQSALQKLLSLELGDSIKEENGNWLVAQGETVKSLDDSIAAYLATDEGKAFLPPSGTAGAGSSESKTITPAASADTKAGAALMQAFS